MRTLLVASTGGHLRELFRLQPRLGLEGDDVLWVTNLSRQSKGLLAGQPVTYVPYVGSRNVRRVAANAVRAGRILWHFRPDRVISTGSGIALSFLPLARAKGAHCSYIESGTRVQGPSVTGRALQRIPGIHCYTQHAGWAGPRWRTAGSALDGFEVVPSPDRDLRRAVVTLGTWQQTFRPLIERLLEVLPPDIEVLWQTGHTDVRGLPIAARPWLPPEELTDVLAKADLVVTHAGMGATLDALEAGRCPIAVPRRAALGEQIDNHQVELARELDRRGLVIARTPEAITPDDLFLAARRQIAEYPASPLDLDVPPTPRRKSRDTEAPPNRPIAARVALVVASHEGQATVDDLARQARAGERPRKDYVALAEALNAEVVDSHFLAAHAGRAARLASRWLGIPAGQVVEIFRRRRSFRTVVSHSDAQGLLLALLWALTRHRVPLVLFAAWLTPRKKALLLRSLHVDARIRAFIFYSSVQLEKTAMELGVPREKLHHRLQPVDLDFWRPCDVETEALVCAVGWEARDYATLIRAVRGLDVVAHLAVGTIVFTGDEISPAVEGPAAAARERIVGAAAFQRLGGTQGHDYYQQWVREIEAEGWPDNVVVHEQLAPTALRDLYARSRVVVVPVFEVDFDAGVNVIAEAMAMGKAVIVSASEGQVDLVRHEHTGLYVPPRDPAALRAAVQRLLDDQALTEQLGRNGRAFAEMHLSLDDYVAEAAAIVHGED